MMYLIIFIFAFLFGIWIKVSGETVKLEFYDYIINIDLYFTIIASIVLLFLLIIIIRSFFSITSVFSNVKNRRREKEELLTFEALFSTDLNNIENASKLIKELDERSNRFLLLTTFNAGKSGNYCIFSNNLIKIADKNRNLALLLSYKLIEYFKEERITLRKFIDYCFHSVDHKILSIPFHIEYFALKRDWYTAIAKLKEAVRFSIFLPFEYKTKLATFYCSLAQECKHQGNLKEVYKALLKAQSYCPTLQPINYLIAELYIKLGKIKKASAVLETEYQINPTPQVAKLYISLNNKADRLYSLRPDYYYSYCALASAAIALGEYDLAEQHLKNAIKKAPDLPISLVIVQLQIFRKEYDKAINSLNEIDLSSWICRECQKKLMQWEYQCPSCGMQDCILA